MMASIGCPRFVSARKSEDTFPVFLAFGTFSAVLLIWASRGPWPAATMAEIRVIGANGGGLPESDTPNGNKMRTAHAHDTPNDDETWQKQAELNRTTTPHIRHKCACHAPADSCLPHLNGTWHPWYHKTGRDAPYTCIRHVTYDRPTTAGSNTIRPNIMSSSVLSRNTTNYCRLNTSSPFQWVLSTGHKQDTQSTKSSAVQSTQEVSGVDKNIIAQSQSEIIMCRNNVQET